MNRYQDLDTDNIKNYLKEDDFRKLTIVNDNYQITVQTTLAMFNFNDEPIDGIYRSLIVDLKQKFVLTKKTTKVLANNIYKTLACGGQHLQRQIANQLHHKYLNVISLGHSAFFSLKGHSAVSTDWVSLHHIEHYEHNVEAGRIHFTTVNLKNMRFKFTYKAKKYITERLHNSIEHNNAIRHALFDHLHDKLGLDFTPHNHTKHSIIFKHASHKCYESSIIKLVEDAINHYISKTFDFLQNSDEDYDKIPFICHKMTRNRYNQ